MEALFFYKVAAIGVIAVTSAICFFAILFYLTLRNIVAQKIEYMNQELNSSSEGEIANCYIPRYKRFLPKKEFYGFDKLNAVPKFKINKEYEALLNKLQSRERFTIKLIKNIAKLGLGLLVILAILLLLYKIG